MRLLRVGPVGAERPAVLDDAGVLRDASTLVDDVDGALLADAVRLDRLERARPGLPAVPDGARIGPPVARPGKIVGIGLNYADHAAEAGVALPDEPVVFLKAPSSITGPYDDLVLPSGSVATDWEVELGVVIGGTLRDGCSAGEARRAIGGYVAVNDVTERDRAAAGPTWAKGKCADTFCPIGPWLVTPDEVGDPQRLDLALWVNEQCRQRSSTAHMAVGVIALVQFLSTLMTLEPGDLVLTGTPGGVAVGRPEPKPFLRAGDVVELEIETLGRQRTPVRQRPVSDPSETERDCITSTLDHGVPGS
jgi:2-keto-4-pentenoate hydratase/2-oxohepta-3-ene-1,7-dioic acid hydratase in catechol pathway